MLNLDLMVPEAKINEGDKAKIKQKQKEDQLAEVKKLAMEEMEARKKKLEEETAAKEEYKRQLKKRNSVVIKADGNE